MHRIACLYSTVTWGNTQLAASQLQDEGLQAQHEKFQAQNNTVQAR